MINARLPNYPVSELSSPGILFDAILNSDQFDDWLTDPVYYEDHRRNEDFAVREFLDVWNAGVLKASDPITVRLPRRNGDTVIGAALPWSTRLCAYRVIDALARRISGKIARDKVFGFRRLGTEPLPPDQLRGGGALFSRFGKETASLITHVAAVLVMKPEVKAVDVYDVRRFLSNTRFDRLSSTLQQLAVRPDELRFLKSVLPRIEHLPALDDAWGFLYNFYLLPIDRRLANEKLLFARYGDQYFIFDSRDSGTLQAAASELGLTMQIKGQFAKPLPADQDESIEKMAALFGGWILVSCCITGRDFSHDFPWTLRDMLLNDVLDEPDRLDAYDLLPLLHSIHEARRHGVVFGSLSALPEDFVRYQTTIRPYRDHIRKVIRVGNAKNLEWQVCWAAAILSDLGNLALEDQQMMHDVARNPTIGKFARLQARLAITRSGGDFMPDMVWRDSDLTGSEYEVRTAILLASYLARRGWQQPWQTIRRRNIQPNLSKFLLEYMREV